MAINSSRRLSLSSLFLVLFISFAMRTHAQKFHPSCSNFQVKNSEGVVTKDYGDVTGTISSAVEEAGKIASTAKTTLENAFSELSVFERDRTLQTYTVFQGPANWNMNGATDRWHTVLNSLGVISDYAINKDTKQSPLFVCGDSHLTRYDLDSDGQKILDSKGVQSFQYYDSIMKLYHPIGVSLACADDPTTDALSTFPYLATNPRYIIVCPKVFEYSTFHVIGTLANEDWSDTQYQNQPQEILDTWRSLSYNIFHELTHSLLGYDDYPVTGAPRGEVKAYRFAGSTALLRQNIDAVIKNVDNLGMLALALFMNKCNWSSGKAVGQPFDRKKLMGDAKAKKAWNMKYDGDDEVEL